MFFLSVAMRLITTGIFFNVSKRRRFKSHYPLFKKQLLYKQTPHIFNNNKLYKDLMYLPDLLSHFFRSLKPKPKSSGFFDSIKAIFSSKFTGKK